MSKQVNQADIEAGRIYPPLKNIRDVSVKIACEISEWYYKNGKATAYPAPSDMEQYVRNHLYDTTYTTYVPKTWPWPKEHMEPRNYDQVKK